jgi:type II secretion system protein N
MVSLPAWLRARPAALSPRVRRILRWAGYPLFYLFCLLVFVKFTFPYERLERRIEAAFNAAQTGPDPSRLEIEDLSSYWLRGIEADGVRLVSAAPPPETSPDAKPAEPKATTLDHAHATISLLPLLLGNLSVSYGADAFGGEIDGSYSTSGTDKSLSLDLSDIDVGQVPFLVKLVELPMGGELEGALEFDLPEGQLANANGEVELGVTDLTVGDGKAKIRNTIALPTLNAGLLEFKAAVSEGKLEIETFTVKGPDLELEADGSIRLRDPFEASIADMTLSFKFTDAYRNKSDMTRSLFGAPGSTMPAAFDLDPQNRAAKQPDGSYRWRLTGPIQRMTFSPTGSGAGSPGAATPGGPSRRRPRAPRR